MVKWLFLSLVLLIAPTIKAEVQQVNYYQGTQKLRYSTELLKLAMEATVETFGPYELIPFEHKLSFSRRIAFLTAGEKLNVAHFGAFDRHAASLKAVPAPIFRGMLGYRLLIIRKEDEQAFSEVKSLDDLRKSFVAGFSSQWSDMDILTHNNISVVSASSKDHLYRMLNGKRFDFFPRGLSEYENELIELGNRAKNLMVEPTIAIYYPYPVYFFVTPKDKVLADRIKQGLDIILKNGEFQKVFIKYYGETARKVNLYQRKLFVLDSPLQNDSVAIPDRSWWFIDTTHMASPSIAPMQ